MPKADTTYAAGYGKRHEAERQRWRPHVEARCDCHPNGVICWRCQEWIPIDGPWDLGHDDRDRSRYRGPEHPPCNRAAGARNGNAARAGRGPSIARSW